MFQLSSFVPSIGHLLYGEKLIKDDFSRYAIEYCPERDRGSMLPHPLELHHVSLQEIEHRICSQYNSKLCMHGNAYAYITRYTSKYI